MRGLVRIRRLILLSALFPVAIAPIHAGPSLDIQHTAVVLVDFDGDEVVNPCTPAGVEQIMFSEDDSVDAIYREMSYGQLGFFGQVFGPVGIPDSSTDICDSSLWAAHAEQALADQGVSLAEFAPKVFVFPPNTCSESDAGHGNTGVPVRIFACDRMVVYAHEIGHYFGLNHAGFGASAYGDRTDLMGETYLNPGWAEPRPFHAIHREQLGWLPEKQVLDVAGCQTGIALDPLADDPWSAANPQVVRVEDDANGQPYFVALRAPSSEFEDNLPAEFQNTVHVHEPRQSSDRDSQLLDSLQPGQVYENPGTGVRIVRSNDVGPSAVVDVESPPGGYVPGLRLEPDSQTVGLNETARFTLTIANQDCNATTSTFQVTGILPVTLSGSIEPGSLSIPAGQTGVVQIDLSPTQASGTGAYPFSLLVQRPRKPQTATVGGVLSYVATPQVSGRARCQNGVPAPNVPVSVDCGLQPAAETVTDEQGEFSVEVICAESMRTTLEDEARTQTPSANGLNDFGTWTLSCSGVPGDPYRYRSSVPKLVYSPVGSLPWTVTVLDVQGTPVDGVTVQVSPIDVATENLVSWCASQTDHHPQLDTDALGVAAFQIFAGGCLDPSRLGYVPFVVDADGVELGRVGSASSDAVDSASRLPSDEGYDPGTSASVTMSDTSFHTNALLGAGYEYCSDLDDDGTSSSDQDDFFLIVGDLSQAASCPTE